MLKLFPDRLETIHGVAAALRTGELTCTQVVERCLANIDEWEPKVHAWVLLDRDGALQQAKKLDDEHAFANNSNPLLGIPLGIKDIFDVKGWPTAAGFEPWKDRIAKEDAPVIARLREAGAILLGKTVTTQFASFDPPVTRNPWNLERTPGGSSSGSAAAVACGMCLGAMGSQTGGSITRPASYCGVAGYKPEYGVVCLEGITPLAPTMDHPGPIARTLNDLSILFDKIADYSRSNYRSVLEEGAKPSLGVLRGFFEERADAEVRRVFQATLDTLKAAGSKLTEIALPAEFAEVTAHHRAIMGVEAAEWHEARLAEYPNYYQPRIRGLIEEGFEVKGTTYLRAKHKRKEIRDKLEKLFRKESVFIMPATTTPAPDRTSTGDPLFNSPWSYLGLPCVSFPVGFSKDNMPIAVQLVASKTVFAEPPLFSFAEWCEQVIREANTSSHTAQPI